MIIDNIIIGAGMAGSYIANCLREDNKDFIILESSYKIGGRHQTQKDKDKVLFEQGAWRIHSSHKRMIELCKKLKLTLIEFEKSQPYKRKKIPGLSALDTIILEQEGDIKKSLEKELNTGYQGVFEADSTSHPYSIKEEGTYYIIKEGQEEIVSRLLKTLEKKVFLKHKVMDIEREKKGYKIKVLHNDKEKIFYCNNLFTSQYKYELAKMKSIQTYIQPLIDSVLSIPLNHIYAYTEEDIKVDKKDRTNNNILSQVINPTHDKNWFQVSYSCGRIADFWNRYMLKYGKEKTKNLIQKYVDVKIKDIKNYYWSYAFHMWRPVPNFNIKKAVDFSIQPNPVILDNFYLVGECFSSFQGWSEGALETCQKAISVYRGNKNKIYQQIPKQLSNYFIYNNIIIEVKNWQNFHPGGKESITSHLGEDISKLFYFINHSELSWSILYSYYWGYIKK